MNRRSTGVFDDSVMTEEPEGKAGDEEDPSEEGP
jgi:hypothetical protein